MTEVPGEQLDEEPQDERGAPGSRATGSDKPSAGPADRPAGEPTRRTSEATTGPGHKFGTPAERTRRR